MDSLVRETIPIPNIELSGLESELGVAKISVVYYLCTYFNRDFIMVFKCRAACHLQQHFQEVLKSKIDRGKIERGLILRNEKANDEYSTDFLTR